MIGPLLATACMSVGGVPTQSSGYLRNVGQWTIASALGLYFTADVGQLVLSLWWAILLGIAWALAMGYGFGVWLQWRNAANMPELSAKHMRATSYFAGALFMVFIKRNNPWFMGPLIVSMGLTLAGVQWTAIPSEMSNMAQLFIGISLGVRFQRKFLQTAPQWLLSVAVGTLGMLLASIGFGWALAWSTGLHPATLILGTSPGGIAEMAITAKVLELGAPVVTAFQVCRLIAVLLIVGPLYRKVEVPD